MFYIFDDRLASQGHSVPVRSTSGNYGHRLDFGYAWRYHCVVKLNQGSIRVAKNLGDDSMSASGNTMMLTEIDLAYQRRIDAMTMKEKIGRAAAMLAWTRQQIAARIRKEQPGLSDEQIKWRVALHLYASEPEVVALIQRHLAHVSG